MRTHTAETIRYQSVLMHPERPRRKKWPNPRGVRRSGVKWWELVKITRFIKVDRLATLVVGIVLAAGLVGAVFSLGKLSFCETLLVMKTDPPCFRCSRTLEINLFRLLNLNFLAVVIIQQQHLKHQLLFLFGFNQILQHCFSLSIFQEQY